MQPHREPPTTASDESEKVGRKRTLAKGLTLVAGMAILAGLGIVLHSMWSVEPALGSNESPAEAVKRIPVVLTAAREMTFESTVAVSGSVQAKHFALVSARLPGSLDAVHVDEGDVVEAGKTQLFQTDSLKLTKAVAIARQGLQVAELSVEEKDANLEQVLANREQAEVDLERYRALIRETRSPDSCSTSKRRAGSRPTRWSVTPRPCWRWTSPSSNKPGCN